MAKKTPRSLVALSGSAVAAVYLAGYLATSGVAAGAGAAPAATVLPTAPLPTALVPTPLPTRPSLGRFDEAGRGVGRVEDDGRGRLGRGRLGPGAERAGLAPPTATAVPASARPTPASAPAAQPTATPAAALASGYRDGTYAGAGTSRRGGFEVAVTIQGGRIANVALTRVTTQYPASRIAALPGQVVARQSAQVDRVSGATYSVQAFRQAVEQALAQAGAG